MRPERLARLLTLGFICGCATSASAMAAQRTNAPVQTDTAPVQRVLDDYIGLYQKERLAEWKALFLPGFTATYTNDDGSVTTRTLEEFYERQQAAFARGTVSETLHDVRIARQGRLAHVVAGFDFTSAGTTRRGQLMLLMIETLGQFKIAALTFTYHLQQD